MSITIRTVEDLVRVLEEHPEWRERLLAVLLGQEFLQVPMRLDRIEAVLERLVQSHELLWESHRQLQESHRQLLESHQQLLQSHQQLQASHQQLWESHQQALARLDRLEAIVQQLLESHQQLWESHRQLQESHRQLLESHQMLVAEVRELRQTVEQLVNWMQRLDTDVGKLKGKVLELDYLQHAPARFGYYVRCPRVVNLGHFLDDLRERDTNLVWMNGRNSLRWMCCSRRNIPPRARLSFWRLRSRGCSSQRMWSGHISEPRCCVRTASTLMPLSQARDSYQKPAIWQCSVRC
jgi:uncharacterized protein YoxC